MKNKYFLSFLFFIFCGLSFFLNKSHKIIWLRPQSVHVWRQTDCVSYVLNYYQNNQPFFEPQTHTLTGTNGHTTSEFPIIYFIAAKLYHVFGPHEAIIRAINFALFLAGCTCLFWMCFDFYENKWLAFIPALVTFTCPYLYYYGLNFLPDVPAISLALIGWFLFFNYFKEQRLYYLYLSAFAFCLAALLKVSAGISFVAIPGMMIWLWLKERKLLIKGSHLVHWALLSILVVATNFTWIQFAKYYNNLNDTGQNLLGLFPIWDASVSEILDILKKFIVVWSRVIFHPVVWLWVGVLMAIVIRKRKFLDSHIKVLVLLTGVGSLLYSLMWFRAYMDHDYYMINPFMAFIWIIIAACFVADRGGKQFRNFFVLSFIPILLIATMQARKVQLERYFSPEFKMLNEKYFTIEPYLRSIGISRHDIVFSVPDVSPNITLYFLNQPGWTEAFNEGVDFKVFVDRGLKYFITADTTYIHNPKYSEYVGNLMGYHNGIYIYTIKK